MKLSKFLLAGFAAGKNQTVDAALELPDFNYEDAQKFLSETGHEISNQTHQFLKDNNGTFQHWGHSFDQAVIYYTHRLTKLNFKGGDV